MDLPDPTGLPLPGVPALGGTLADLLPSLSDAGCFMPGGGDADSSSGGSASGPTGSGNTAFPGSAASGTISDCVAGPMPQIAVKMGETHRMATSVLSGMSRKLAQLASQLAKTEVERAFHLYQANRRVLFNTFRRH